MGSRNNFTETDVERIIELHNKGLYNREIADIFNTSKSSISKILQGTGLPSRHPWMSEERKNEIKEYYERCMSRQKTCDAMHCGMDTINKIIKEFNLDVIPISELRRKYYIYEDFFDVIDTEEKAYALGLYYSDGSISKSSNQAAIALQARDRKILDDLSNLFAGSRPLSFVKYSNKNINWQDQYVFIVTNKKIHDDLIKHGATPNKSLTLKFPTTVPDNLIRHFVRGYFDGDGSISKSEDRCTLISTEDFCTKLSTIVKEVLNINSSILYCHNRNKPTRTFQVAGRNQVKLFLAWLYNDSNIYLERKYKLYCDKYLPIAS